MVSWLRISIFFFGERVFADEHFAGCTLNYCTNMDYTVFRPSIGDKMS